MTPRQLRQTPYLGQRNPSYLELRQADCCKYGASGTKDVTAGNRCVDSMQSASMGTAPMQTPATISATHQRAQPPISLYRIHNVTSTIMAGSDPKWDFFDVYLDLNERGLGMSIKGGLDSPDRIGRTDVYVSRILNGGAVHKDGRIQIGDILLEVNNTSLVRVTHRTAVDTILKAGPYMHFKLKRHSASHDSSDIYEQIDCNEDEPLLDEDEQFDLSGNDARHHDCTKVELIRNDHGFGFSLVGGLDNQVSSGDSAIYVNNIIQNSPAHQNGVIQVGDQIVAVNDTNLERVPYNWALQVIRNSPALSVFTVRKAISWD